MHYGHRYSWVSIYDVKYTELQSCVQSDLWLEYSQPKINIQSHPKVRSVLFLYSNKRHDLQEGSQYKIYINHYCFLKELGLNKTQNEKQKFSETKQLYTKVQWPFFLVICENSNIKFSMAKFLTFTQNCHWCSAYNLSMSFLYDISVVDGMSSPLIMKQRGSYWVKFCVYIVYIHTAKSLWFDFPS